MNTKLNIVWTEKKNYEGKLFMEAQVSFGVKDRKGRDVGCRLQLHPEWKEASKCSFKPGEPHQVYEPITIIGGNAHNTRGGDFYGSASTHIEKTRWTQCYETQMNIKVIDFAPKTVEEAKAMLEALAEKKYKEAVKKAAKGAI